MVAVRLKRASSWALEITCLPPALPPSSTSWPNLTMSRGEVTSPVGLPTSAKAAGRFFQPVSVRPAGSVSQLAVRSLSARSDAPSSTGFIVA